MQDSIEPVEPQESESQVTPSEQSVTRTNVSPHKKKHTALKVVLIVFGICILLYLVAYLLILVSFSGGVGNVAREFKPAPNATSKSLTNASSAAADQINTSFRKLESGTALTPLATGSHDSCYKGQNNYKVQEGYTYKCTYRQTRFYGFNGDFKATMLDYDKKVLAIGWQQPPNSFGMQKVISNYYDQYYGPSKPKPSSFPTQYLVSDLPSPSPYKNSDQRLGFVFAEKTTTDLFELGSAQKVNGSTSVLFEKINTVNTQEVFEKVTAQNQYVLMVSIEIDYFSN